MSNRSGSTGLKDNYHRRLWHKVQRVGKNPTEPETYSADIEKHNANANAEFLRRNYELMRQHQANVAKHQKLK